MYEKNIFRRLRDRYRAPLSRAVDYDDFDYKEYLKKKLDAYPAGPGLKEYEIDMNLYFGHDNSTPTRAGTLNFYDSGDKVLDEYHKKHPINENPPVLPNVNVYAQAIVGGGGTHNTIELSEWMHTVLPQTGYFTPEMVEEAVAETGEISVEKEIRGDLVIWQFTDVDGNSFELTRMVDGKEPTENTNPYLIARYEKEYDFETGEIVATPILSDAGGTMNYRIFRGILSTELIHALKLQEARVKQDLDFIVKGEGPRSYISDSEGFSLEYSYVYGRASVKVDLPEDFKQQLYARN